ncbi:hypothetical protein C1646_760143 [Rhizophagus diaphanus]|nr:hypothetical protein C1646_760143 [Rhizophagus diaphanus] [Rhizophagus sp. MUCL 43196]
MIKPQTLAYNSKKILSILSNISKIDGDCTSLIKYPVLIGSRAAKWHLLKYVSCEDLIYQAQFFVLYLSNMANNIKFYIKGSSYSSSIEYSTMKELRKPFS